MVSAVCSRSQGQSRRSRAVRRHSSPMARSTVSSRSAAPSGTVVPQPPLASSRNSRGPDAATTGAPDASAIPWPPSQPASGSPAGSSTGPAVSSARQAASGTSAGSPGPRAISVRTGRSLRGGRARRPAGGGARGRLVLRRIVRLLLLRVQQVGDLLVDLRLQLGLLELGADLLLHLVERLLRALLDVRKRLHEEEA